ncbi:MAG TPA: cyclic nucleotide-binding domain-containing protein, partial [Kofleriaceae bacterium]|nr:cyclic nucleotide-binding domain-containing protein [Kofleriaceae bacterium]
GGVRGGAQILTLVVQLFVARGLLARIGTGRALLLAPFVALASGLGLVVAPILAVAIATQASAKVLDSAIETPAEKLAQTLLPTVVRGRVAGFLEGTAKRAGAVVGGLIAAALASSPTVFYVITAVAAALWLLASLRISRELPALAIEHVAETRSRTDALEEGAVIDDRAVQALIKELDGPRPERAAEVLVRLHDQGRTDAVTPLVKAATETGMPSVWAALVATLDAPAEVHGKTLLEAAQAAKPKLRELAIRALGLAGGVPPDAFDQWRDPDRVRSSVTEAAGASSGELDRVSDPIPAVTADARPGSRARRDSVTGGAATVAMTAEVARLRVAGDWDALIGELADASRESDPIGRVAIDELVSEIRRQDSAGQHERVLEAARHLTRALRRGRGDGASRTAAFGTLARVVEELRAQRSAELSLMRADLLELVRDRVEQGASKAAPDTALVSLIHKPVSAGHADEAVEVAAALRLYGELLEGADTVDGDDLRRITRALGEPDDEVRLAAEAALVGLGPAAAGELLATVAWGRRRARDRAAALLADLPVTPATIDRLVDAELDALEQTATAITVFTQAGDELVARRLDERLREIAHTVLLLVAARRRSTAISRAAVAWQHARAGQERARALAVIEAAMPRALVTRLVEAVDDVTPSDRKAAFVRAGGELPSRDAVVKAELAGRDRLSRALVLHVLGAVDRSAHRETIAKAAQAEALAASPTELLRRLTKMTEPTADTPVDEGASDMPSRVETLIALGRVPLLAGLSTRQLADVAERARWMNAREGSVVVSGGDPIDALIVVEDGELQIGDRRIAKGEVVDELACVAPAAAAADLTVIRSARLIRLERVDFEELVDDVPGLASSVCRALGERARRAEDASYRSPLASRAG